MSFENWTIEDLFTRCMDCDDMTLEMDKEEFAALRRKIAELRQAGNSPVIPEWIPVSDRMPETYVNVLLTDEYNDICIGQLEFEGDIYFYVVGSTHRYKATHWMPLPAAAQEVVIAN